MLKILQARFQQYMNRKLLDVQAGFYKRQRNQSLLQGIFLAEGSNPCLLQLLHCRWILYRWATRKALVSPIQAANLVELVHPISNGRKRKKKKSSNYFLRLYHGPATCSIGVGNNRRTSALKGNVISLMSCVPEIINMERSVGWIVNMKGNKK